MAVKHRCYRREAGIVFKQNEMKYLRTVKGCTRTHQLRNEDIQNEFGIFPLYEQITEYRGKWMDIPSLELTTRKIFMWGGY
jgi:hypothetical protein